MCRVLGLQGVTRLAEAHQAGCLSNELTRLDRISDWRARIGEVGHRAGRILRAVTATYVLDGTQVRTLEDFWRLIGGAVNGPGGYFGKNLDSFADCLSGGFGQPDDDDYVVEWRDHQASRNYLSHPETARQLEILLSCSRDQMTQGSGSG